MTLGLGGWGHSGRAQAASQGAKTSGGWGQERGRGVEALFKKSAAHVCCMFICSLLDTLGCGRGVVTTTGCWGKGSETQTASASSGMHYAGHAAGACPGAAGPSACRSLWIGLGSAHERVIRSSCSPTSCCRCGRTSGRRRTWRSRKACPCTATCPRSNIRTSCHLQRGAKRLGTAWSVRGGGGNANHRG